LALFSCAFFIVGGLHVLGRAEHGAWKV
jgi:hypothetical protein